MSQERTYMASYKDLKLARPIIQVWVSDSVYESQARSHRSRHSPSHPAPGQSSEEGSSHPLSVPWLWSVPDQWTTRDDEVHAMELQEHPTPWLMTTVPGKKVDQKVSASQ